jgi:(2Fe-2S) ferredoxin
MRGVRIEGGCYRDVTITLIKQLVEELLEKELPVNH